MSLHHRTPLAAPVYAVEGAAALDPLVTAADRLCAGLVADPLRRDVLQGAWLGHALHPLLVEVPMGTWMSAAVLDLAGGRGARQSAQLLTGLGLVAALPTALSGWAEYAEAGPRARRVGVVHAGANGLAAGLQLGSWAARRSGRHGLGRVLCLVGMGLAGAGGFLGGHVAVARKVGTHDPSFGAETETAAR